MYLGQSRRLDYVSTSKRHAARHVLLLFLLFYIRLEFSIFNIVLLPFSIQ